MFSFELKTAQVVLSLLTGAGLPALAQSSTNPTMSTNRTEVATLGGGCFWCLEAVFERLPGVLSVTSGFAGGHTANPTYEQVCTGDTGHAEVTQITFDPARVTYAKLLEVFWQAHDPTTLNRQGADVGTQYRSIILCHGDAQLAAAEKSRAAAQKLRSHPIVTEIVPFTAFYPAEEYHRAYYDQHRREGYCQVVIAPKLEKLEQKKMIAAEPQVQPGH